MELRQRRTVSRFVRFLLIALAVGIAIAWLSRRTPEGVKNIQIESPPSQALGSGDLQIFNEDTTVDLVLQGTRIYAGLSPKIVEKVRGDLARSTGKDTAGIGGAIAQLVKQQVADKIDTRVVYDIDAIRDIRYDEPSIVVEWKRGGEEHLFGKVKVDGDRNTNRFRRADAERFIAAVKARQRSGEF
jgi:hypothetical protein